MYTNEEGETTATLAECAQIEVGVAAGKYDNKTIWMNKSMIMAANVAKTVYLADPEATQRMFVTETQENWFGEKGEHSKNSGAIQKLYFFTGILCKAMSELPRMNSIYGIGPTQWKGQAPKDVMQKRAVKFGKSMNEFIKTGMKHDAGEALLIGKYALKYLSTDTYKHIVLKKPFIPISPPVARVSTMNLISYM